MGNTHAWAPMCQPIQYSPLRFRSAQHATVCAAISVNSGLVYSEVRNGAFKSETFITFLDRLLEMTEGKYVCLFMDNAAFHKSHATYDFMMQHHRDRGQQLHFCFNAPHRPDLNGIEKFWAIAKSTYRKQIT